MAEQCDKAHEEAVIGLIDATPKGLGSQFRALFAKAQSLGIGFLNLTQFLWHDHEARDTFIADCQAGDVGKAIDDVITDYRAANP